MNQLVIKLAALGFKVFPIKKGAKFPPLWAGWQDKARAAVSASWPDDANTGIHCDGLLVVDVDPKKGGDVSLQALDAINDLPETLTTRTPTGGRHFFFRLPEGVQVSNSVGKLGPGLDVRSRGGYVVAPGSTVPAGVYRFESDMPMADAPQWLIDRCGVAVPKVSEKHATVSDAPQSALERAEAWLSTHPGAVEGQGGDMCTYITACRLRDFGISANQALGLLWGSWNERCAPPWSMPALETKVRNAYSYAQEEAGKLMITEDDFAEPTDPTWGKLPEAAVPYAGPPGSTRRNRPVRLQELAKDVGSVQGSLVRGLLDRRTQAVLYGAPGEGKSFLALDLSYAVAAGKPWMGKRTHQGLVLYLAYEGTGGLGKRAAALRQHYGTKDVPLYIQASNFNLRELAGRKELASILSLLPEKPVLIVIDTLARAMRGGDENSAQDMGALLDGTGALAEHTGACVLLVHHCGKSGKGARGSSALLGAIETELGVEDRTLRATKQRDIEPCAPLGFKLHPVQVGVDEEGEDITSCVVIEAKVPAVSSAGKLKGNAKLGWEVLCDLRPTNEPLTDQEWMESCAFMPDTRRRRGVWEIKQRLKKAGLVECLPDGTTRRKME